jgi:hypothetical protein
MSLFKRALERIEENKLKKFNCIPFDEKLPRTSEYLSGPQQGRYYIVSGASGAGKSQLTDELFVFTPFEFTLNNKEIDIDILYWSLELDGETKMHQWIAKRLYENYGIRTNVDIIRSVGKVRINDNIHMAVKETNEYFSKLESKLKFYEGSYSPSNIIEEIENYSIQNGKLDNNGVYIPNNPNRYVIIIVDHASLLSLEPNMNIKLCIEKLSKYFVKCKNNYKYIPVLIQQQSAEKENVDHYKASKMEPSKDGLAESKLTYNDCDVALGIFQPQKHEIRNYRGYDMTLTGDAYRNFSIFKNRFGISNINVGLYFDGATNFWKEMPKKENINTTHYDMIRKRNPNW